MTAEPLYGNPAPAPAFCAYDAVNAKEEVMGTSLVLPVLSNCEDKRVNTTI